MADPLETLDTSPRYNANNQLPVSQKTHAAAGILTTVFGLDELPSHGSEAVCIWLLHPRGGTRERMAGIANALIMNWNQRSGSTSKGLIAVALDHRNHGTRMVDPLRNEAWRQGNPQHAQDMYSIYQGTAQDVSVLIDHLPSITERTIIQNLVLGVSLGGHAAWSCILHDSRITAAVIMVGCPDYVNLMANRARLSKIPSWKDSYPAGSRFLHSESFPSSLLDVVRSYDPACLFLGGMDAEPGAVPLRSIPIRDPTDAEKESLRPLLTRCLAGKKILNISGGRDKAVPYNNGEAFLSWLKRAIAPDGWFAEGDVTLRDVVYENAGHEVFSGMADEAVQFITGILASGKDSESGSARKRVTDVKL